MQSSYSKVAFFSVAILLASRHNVETCSYLARCCDGVNTAESNTALRYLVLISIDEVSLDTL